MLDPQVTVPNVIAFLAQANAGTGEGVIAYNKVGNGQDTLFAWQAAVNAVTGLSVSVGVDNGDTYAIVDGNNNILNVINADPACGDSVPGYRLLLAPAGCSTTWTYNGTTFVAPVFTPIVH